MQNQYALSQNQQSVLKTRFSMLKEGATFTKGCVTIVCMSQVATAISQGIVTILSVSATYLR